MIYLLKFGASFLLPPGIFIAAFAILAALLWKRARRIATWMAAVTAVFYLLSTPYISSALLGFIEDQYDPPTVAEGDAVVLLGGGATSDTPDIGAMGNLSGSAANRLITAARLAKRLDLPIIATGGQVYSDTGCEAVVTKRILMQLGIAEDRIFEEGQSLNTKQNAEYTEKILREQGFTRPILVTSAFHMPRSVINFEKVGIHATPFPADYKVNRRNDLYFNQFAPSSTAIENSAIFFRECLGIAVAKLVR